MQLINQDGRDVTAETLMGVRKVISGTGIHSYDPDGLAKATGTVTIATGLVAYDLEAPSKSLYPVLTPIRNAIPRITKSSGAGLGPNWKAVTAIAGNTSSGVSPWVPEGQRAGRMAITVADVSATYVTIGLETDVTFEAQSAAAGFEDEMSAAGTRLLQQTMVLEENAILGGNRSVLLGTPATPTLSTATTGGTLAALTYKVYVVALTYEGYLRATLAAGVGRAITVTGMDAATFTLFGGSSKLSAVGSQATTGTTSTLSGYTTAIKGAVAYAWFIGEVGTETLEAITTLNSFKITALAGTGAAIATVTSPTVDYSRNSTIAYDGLLYAAWNTSTAYYVAQATGTPGTGTPLTASGHGTITEIDTALRAFWDSYRLSPDVIYVNAQELNNIMAKCFTMAGGATSVRFNQSSGEQATIFAVGQIIGWYTNPFSLDGGQQVPIKLHPTLPAGTIFFWCQNLPAYYQAANVPQVAQVQCRRDYYQIPWPIVTRANATGVYCESVLKVYAPFALGTITNIGNG